MTNREELEEAVNDMIEKKMPLEGQNTVYLCSIAQSLALIADELGTIANAIGGEYKG